MERLMKARKDRMAIPQMIDAYRKQTREFRDKFGREMSPDDPFFFDPNAATPQYRCAADAELALNLLVEVMVEAGVAPSAIFAFKRTGGLFPSSTHPLEPRELADWNAAVDEYFEKFHNTRQQ